MERLIRVLDGELTEFDDEVIVSDADIKIVKVDEDALELIMPSSGTLNFKHWLTHLPKDPKGCRACYLSNSIRSHSRKRPISGVTVDSEDSKKYPFGACLHMEHIAMKHGSPAASVAKVALIMTDEKSKFLGNAPARSRKSEIIVDAVHKYEGPDSQIRRWWTDNAPEFKEASRIIRSTRPLAHHVSIPYRPQSNAIAERMNRTIEEGTRCLLLRSGFPDTWWPFALSLWMTCWNTTVLNSDGQTPWQIRFSSELPFVIYPSGALVLLRPPNRNETKGKWDSRLNAAALVNIGLGPGCQWARTYSVIQLDRLLGDNRPSRINVRKVCEVIFPDTVSFPLRQRLALHGAFRDATVPGPHVTDDAMNCGFCTLQG